MRKLGNDAVVLAVASGAALLVIVLGALLAPATVDSDPTASTYNSGAAGVKGAYLLLSQLGYRTQRLEESAASLAHADAAHTTLILADAGTQDYRKEAAPIADFLRRGGRVLSTGAISATLLPDAHLATSVRFATPLCYTTPQGFSDLARAGRVTTSVSAAWSAANGLVRVDQACGDDAVVVHYPVSKGEVIWWSSTLPMNNRGLKEDPSLRLLLASVGEPGRAVIFDEFIHGAAPSLWGEAAGTPVFAMGWQLAGVALLLVFSFGRRNGPLRALASPPRTSPLEFAESMGDLYRKAEAVDVATSCAERRLMQFLELQGGIPRAALQASPEVVAETVAERFRYRSPAFAEDIRAAREAGENKLSAKSALRLVQQLDRHMANLAALMKHSDSVRAAAGDTQAVTQRVAVMANGDAGGKRGRDA
jgi:hypothetical protein